ncbi:MAG: hypothetical protein HQK50_08370 [Oligoflexia bacterium]|nr:hypothetical protein [Oligoflexia bacterium]MBF0365572.1 hypothetical protein [Oligoflexia bacterium]
MKKMIALALLVGMFSFAVVAEEKAAEAAPAAPEVAKEAPVAAEAPAVCSEKKVVAKCAKLKEGKAKNAYQAKRKCTCPVVEAAAAPAAPAVEEKKEENK